MMSLKKLKTLRLRPDCTIKNQDEVHFSVESTKIRTWSLKGKRPVVKSYAGRKSVAYSGYVNPMTGELIVHKVSWFTYETVLQSLRDLIAIHPGDQKIVVVMDNAPWHKKAKRYIATMPECADIAERIEILSLPPYSPDLNPIERVWRIARREQTHNTFFPDLQTLTDKLDNYFARFRDPNSKLVTL